MKIAIEPVSAGIPIRLKKKGNIQISPSEPAHWWPIDLNCEHSNCAATIKRTNIAVTTKQSILIIWPMALNISRLSLAG